MVVIAFEGTPGCFLVQRTPPSFLAGSDGKLVSKFFAGLADLVLDDEQMRTLESLTEIPDSSAGTPFTAYATESKHPLAPAGGAIARLFAARAAEAKDALLVYVLAGAITISSRGTPGSYLDLIELAAECHRKLTSLRTRPLR